VYIDISPAQDLYVVEFAFPRHLGISVIIPATCGLAAKLRAWTMFPEHKRTASRTRGTQRYQPTQRDDEDTTVKLVAYAADQCGLSHPVLALKW
jgi:hypothetical protein